MPKSKRDKKVSLTKIQKPGLEQKQHIIEEIHTWLDSYARVFVFSVENMRNTKLKDIRQHWKHSRFFFGKNKVMTLAFGKTSSDEYKDNSHKISKKLQGQTGVFFTNKTKNEVVKWFCNYSERDYARSGTVAIQKVTIEAGPLPAFSHSMEPQLRQLGLPTKLVRGVIHLTTDYKVCDLGDTLTPEQCRILKLFGHMMADFCIQLEAMWSNNGSFEVLDTSASDKSDRPTQVTVKAKQKSPDEDNAMFEAEDDVYSESCGMADEKN